MSDYYYLAIQEIVFAKSLNGYGQAIKYMINHELGKAPKDFNRQIVISMIKDLAKEHQNLKNWRVLKNRAENHRIAEEAYRIIKDKYIKDDTENTSLRNLNL